MSDENKSRISLVCAPHDGSRSPAFLKFQRDFRAGTQAEFVKDDEYSVWQALNDIDQGGQDANAPAMPGGNALAPTPCGATLLPGVWLFQGFPILEKSS